MFAALNKKIQKQFESLVAGGTLFQVTIDRDRIWQIYLDSFAPEKRQENDCRACRSFLRQYGAIVGIKDNQMVSIWDINPDDEEFNAPIKALSDYIHSLPISGIFLNNAAKCGTEKNLDSNKGIIWQHYYLELPSKFVNFAPGTAQGNAVANHDVLKRSLEEITDDAVSTVQELIAQNSLYRGAEMKGMVDAFQKLKVEYKKTKAKLKDNFIWAKANDSQAVSRIKNSAIGTLLNDLSAGEDLDKAVRAYERVTAPANYKRPTALVTPRMVEEARKRLEELGLIGALERRVLSDTDLTLDNAIFRDRAKGAALLNVFDEIKKDVTINPKTLSKVEEISIKDFVEKVVPTAKSIKVLVENDHIGNFATLVGPKEKDSGRLFKWGNDFSWHYTGGVADSIKERVKQAGGNVAGILRASMAWDNKDDLDIWLIEPNGFKVYYGNKRRSSPTGAILDLDANGSDGLKENPCENIYWTNPPKQEGRYKIQVHQFNKRDSNNNGFTVELDWMGEVYNFAQSDNGRTGKIFDIVEFNYSKKDGVRIIGDTSLAKYNSKEKWNIKTGQFHRIKAIVNSPNYWQGHAIGNKHYFFLIDGCKTDEKVRAYYNEFLQESLMADRKVFEVLANKLEVEPSNNELSGLGFSETIRSHIFAEIEGNFRRTIKIKF